MHQQAQLRLNKNEVEKLGAEVYVVLAMDLHRTRLFKEENLLLSKGNGPFSKEKSLVYATALSDPAGYASALYGVARKCLRWGAWVENQPHWFVIDPTGRITFMLEPRFNTPTSYEEDVDLVLEALRKAARGAKK
jgi:peroxiredoxin